MNKGVIFAIFALIVIAAPLVLAEDIDVDVIDRVSVVISEIDNAAVFDFVIQNELSGGMHEIYSLIGMEIEPRGLFFLKSGKSVIEVKATPQAIVREKPGLYLLEYRIRNLDEDILKDKLRIRVVELSEAIEISAEDVSIDEKYVNVTIENVKNTNIEDLDVRISSEFFDFSKNLSLGPEEKVTYVADVDGEAVKGLVAGPYIIKMALQENESIYAEGIVNYLESEAVSTQKDSSGIIIRKNSVSKTNTGNTPLSVQIEMKRDILTRLFTSHSIEPGKTDRSGLFVTYQWTGQIGPEETFEVVSSTNYTLPFILILLIVATIVFVKVYLQTDVVVKKRVHYVKTKGGEFALKVILNVKSRRNVENVNIIDRLPGMVKLYNKFGKQPDKIDEKSRRIFWSIPRLGSGESRVFSYIIYSKMKVLGKFELPPATAVYTKDGEKGVSKSNRTFFMTEVRTGEED